MDTTAVNFAKRLGKKIVHKNQELILHSVTLGNYVLALNGSAEPKPILIEECKLLLTTEELEQTKIPPEIAVIWAAGKYIDAVKFSNETNEEKENAIVLELCRCAGVDYDELRRKPKHRKKELVQVRQIHMTVRQYFTRKESLEKTGEIYSKGHSDVIHSIKKVKFMCDGLDIEARKMFEPAFRMIATKFPDAHKKLNLNWL